MNPIDWLFNLLSRFVPIAPDEYAKMLNDARTWWKEIIFFDPGNPSVNNEPINKIRYHSEKWYVKLALAVLFLIGVKMITEWMRDSPKSSDELDRNDRGLL